MFRVNGAIPELTKDKYPKRLLVFDTEAFRGGFQNGVELQTFRLAVSRYLEFDKARTLKKDTYEQFTTPFALADYIDNLSRKDKTLYVYAHNLKYDLQLSGLLTRLLETGWKITLFVFDDPPTFIRLKKNRSSILFVDTFNYWQTSLEKMGQQMTTRKAVMPEDSQDNQVWFEYCKTDVRVLSEYLLSFMQFLDDNDLAGLGLTLASQAFRSYRHRFMKQEIIIHNNEKVLALERKAYSGGRVEAFYIGEMRGIDLYKLDVNSMYPFVMKKELYPFEFVSYSVNVTLSKLEKLLRDYYLIGDFIINTEKPFLAVKHKHKLIFPVGVLSASMHQAEIIEALENGYLREIRSLAIYKKGDIFSDYVDFFYNLKLEAESKGDMITRHQAKILMNSLYGKFGQRNSISKIIENPEGYSFKRLTGYSESLGRTVEVNYLGSQMEIRYTEGESTYSFPAIAGAVTAYARMYLYRLMQRAGLENLFYVDTDSLIVNQEGYNRLSESLSNSELGYLKLESNSRVLRIFGPKDYQFGDEIKHKGIPKKALELSPGKWQYEQFRGAKSWISQGLPEGVEIYEREKVRKSEYDKGYINPSGFVSPLRFFRGDN